MTDAERLATLKRHRQHYALVNALLRQGNIAGLRALGYTEAQIAKLKQPDGHGRIGFAVTQRNTENKITRLKRRMRRSQ